MADSRFKFLAIKTLEEESTLVFEYSWPNNLHIGDFGVSDYHALTP